jgi:solute carrier family 9 (sodium/hydrogen exchanger), member 3
LYYTGVILLVAIANRFRIHKLSPVDQFVMSYGGLRGAIAFALVLLINPNHVPLQPLFVTTTICVIYFTVFLQGITIKPLVRILNVKRAEKRKPTMNERIHERFIDHMMAGMEDIVGKTGNYTIRDKFKRFDNRFIRPYLIRDLKVNSNINNKNHILCCSNTNNDNLELIFVFSYAEFN